MKRKIQNRSLQMESLEDRKLMTTVTELGGTAITGDAVTVSGHAKVCTSYDNDHDSSRSNNGSVGEGGGGGVDHNSSRSNNGIDGQSGSGAGVSTESRSGGEQHKIYDYSQCLWNDVTSTEAGDGQGIGIFPIPIATPSDHVSQHPNCEVDTNKLSIGAGTKAILNGSVRGDLMNNGMLVVNGDQMDSFFDVFTEISIADEPQGSNPTPHPLPAPEFLDACFKDQLEHGPGMHDTLRDVLDVGPVTSGPAAEVMVDVGPMRQLEHGPGMHDTRPDGLDTGPVTTAPSAEVKLDSTPQSTSQAEDHMTKAEDHMSDAKGRIFPNDVDEPATEVKLDAGPINQLEQQRLLSAAAVERVSYTNDHVYIQESFAPEAGKATEEKPNLTTSFGNTAPELANETEAPAPMESNSGNGTNSLGGGNEDELEQPGELPAGNQPADNAGAGSPSDLFTMPLDPNGDTSRILADGEDDNKEDVDDTKDDEVGGWDIFVSWLTSFLPGGTTLSGLETGAQGVTNVHKYIGSMNSSLAKQTGDDSYIKGN